MRTKNRALLDSESSTIKARQISLLKKRIIRFDARLKHGLVFIVNWVNR